MKQLLSSYQTQIEDVKLNLNTSTGSVLHLLQKKFKNLEIKIKEAIVRKEKMELLVKNSDVGYVYIASNIGSFGENIYKIGITKSLKPLSSINSLSSAVPFPFDVHGLIFSEEVTRLERELHDAFAGNKVNLIHENSTFFNVSWDLIEQKVNALGSQVTLLKTPEAKEFRETKMLKKQNKK